MDIQRYLTVRRKDTSDTASTYGKPRPRKHLPLIATPVDENHRGTDSDALSTTGSGRPSYYKKHHEASTIELFYDLFFVANLVYFTSMYEHVDAKSIANYVELFTLLWFTWLSVTLFDVRFGMDSILNRFFKACHFGIMTAYTFAGPVFDSKDSNTDKKPYGDFAMVLAISRIVLAVQYLIVAIQSRSYKPALLPLGLTVLVNIISASLFFVARAIFPGSSGHIDQIHVIFLFLVAIADGLSTMIIAIFWRVISFKHTHLVERVGLLTLIITGEGIVGMIKSTACITKGSYTNTSAEIGPVVAAMLLIYLVWMLYFDQIEHERFGTIRQQIWALLHYPLHVAILLCVEGSTSMIVWNSAALGLRRVWSLRPADLSQPGAAFASSNDFISNLNSSMLTIEKHYKSKVFSSLYNYNADISIIANISQKFPFKSAEWNAAASPTVDKIFLSASSFVFQAHSETMSKMLTVAQTPADPYRLIGTYAVFDTVMLYFYLGAASMLLILGIMYWFGKLHKTKYEFGEIINRTFVGFILGIFGVTVMLSDKSESGFKFRASEWIIAIVVASFFFVIALDNILLAVANRTYKRKSRWSALPTQQYGGDSDREALFSKQQMTPDPADDGASQMSGTAYQPYASYPDSADPQTYEFSSSVKKEPKATVVPINLAMRHSFQTSHKRQRSYEESHGKISGEDSAAPSQTSSPGLLRSPGYTGANPESYGQLTGVSMAEDIDSRRTTS